MKKIFTVFAALVCGMAINAKTIYLKTGGDEVWGKDAPAFYVHAWGGSVEYEDVKMASVSGDIFSATIDEGSTSVIFLRQDPKTTNVVWTESEGMWNKTGNLTIESGKNMYVIKSWSEAYWDVYGGGDNPGGGGDNPGGNPGGGEDDKDYYLMGNKNGMESGNIVVPTAEELFEGGQLTYSFPGHAENGNRGYFFIMVCDPGATVGVQYMLKDYSEAKHATLYQAQANNAYAKLGVPGPTVTFYLYYGKEAGTFELSTEPLEGYTLVGGGSAEQGIRNTVVAEKARKVIVDGQLRIMRGDKVYDATGRQL